MATTIKLTPEVILEFGNSYEEVTEIIETGGGHMIMTKPISTEPESELGTELLK